MLKKPAKYDEIEVNDFDFSPITLGGHKGIIMSVEEYTSPVSGNTSLKVYVDTDKSDSQPDYFKEQYAQNTNQEKKWSNSAIKYVSLREDEKCVKMLKSFLTSVENSNSGYTYDWDKEVSQLKNKKIGLVFGLEEYQKQDGSIGTIPKLVQFRSLDKVDNVKIPKVKKLDESFVEYEEYMNNKNSIEQQAVNIFGSDIVTTTNDLPFEL